MTTKRRKIVAIIISIIISPAALLVALLLLNIISEALFGTNSVGGKEVLNVNGGVFVVVLFAVTITALYGFYKLLTKNKKQD